MSNLTHCMYGDSDQVTHSIENGNGTRYLCAHHADAYGYPEYLVKLGAKPVAPRPAVKGSKYKRFVVKYSAETGSMGAWDLVELKFVGRAGTEAGAKIIAGRFNRADRQSKI